MARKQLGVAASGSSDAATVASTTAAVSGFTTHRPLIWFVASGVTTPPVGAVAGDIVIQQAP